MLLVIGVAAALALSACGSSPAAKKAALKDYVASLGGSPNLQVTLTANFTGAGASKAEKVLSVLSYGINLASTTGNPISQSAGKVNWEVTANVKGSPLLDIRDIGGNLYFTVDVSQVSNIPGVKVSSGELADVGLVFGGKWFELSQSFLNSVVPKKDASDTSAFENTAIEAQVIDAITNLIVTTPSTATSNGYTETGTLLSAAKAIQAAIPSLAGTKIPTGKDTQGTFSLSVSTSGSSATGASISITAQNGTKGNATGSLSAAFAHANVAISVPSNVTVITKQFLSDLGLGSKL
jgi:hypothetical protein